MEKREIAEIPEGCEISYEMPFGQFVALRMYNDEPWAENYRRPEAHILLAYDNSTDEFLEVESFDEECRFFAESKTVFISAKEEYKSLKKLKEKKKELEARTLKVEKLRREILEIEGILGK